MKTALPIQPVSYDPQIHSRERLLRQIESNQAHHEAPLLIGSLGRAAALGSEQEFTIKGETAERDRRGFARDIDLFLLSGRLVEFPPAPFPVDTQAITGHAERIVIENGDYWLVDDLLGITVALDPDVFAPQRMRLFGELDVTSFSALTHYALLYVIFDDPKKYAVARRVMQTYLSGANPLESNDLLRPFLEFHRLRRGSMLNHARNLYRRAFPLNLRYAVRPYVRGLIESMPGRHKSDGPSVVHQPK